VDVIFNRLESKIKISVKIISESVVFKMDYKKKILSKIKKKKKRIRANETSQQRLDAHLINTPHNIL